MADEFEDFGGMDYYDEDNDDMMRMAFADRERYGGVAHEEVRQKEKRFKDPKERLEAELYVICDDPIFPDMDRARKKRLVEAVVNLKDSVNLNGKTALAAMLLRHESAAVPTKAQLSGFGTIKPEDVLRYWYFIRDVKD